jgi:hypothetical protein
MTTRIRLLIENIPPEDFKRTLARLLAKPTRLFVASGCAEIWRTEILKIYGTLKTDRVDLPARDARASVRLLEYNKGLEIVIEKVPKPKKEKVVPMPSKTFVVFTLNHKKNTSAVVARGIGSRTEAEKVASNTPGALVLSEDDFDERDSVLVRLYASNADAQEVHALAVGVEGGKAWNLRGLNPRIVSETLTAIAEGKTEKFTLPSRDADEIEALCVLVGEFENDLLNRVRKGFSGAEFERLVQFLQTERSVA